MSALDGSLDAPYIFEISTRIAIPPSDTAARDAVFATVKALAEKHPGGPNKVPLFVTREIGYPVGLCLNCGAIVGLRTDRKFQCVTCGELSEEFVSWRVPRELFL